MSDGDPTACRDREVRTIIGRAARGPRETLQKLDETAIAFIQRSPFLLVASADAEGRADVSPKATARLVRSKTRTRCGPRRKGKR